MIFSFKIRRRIGLAAALLFLAFPVFLTGDLVVTAGAQRRSTPTPKKKTTPTPKRAKATPTPKKSQSKTAPAKSKTGRNTAAKSNTRNDSKKNAKTNTRTAPKKTDPRSSRTAAKTVPGNDPKKNSKTTSRNTRADSRNAAKTPVRTPPKTPPKPKSAPTASVARMIVAGYSVPVRAEARSGAPPVARLKLGTVVDVSEKNQSWLRVRYTQGGRTANGWIAANAVNDLDAGGRSAVYRQIAERGYRTDLDFGAAAELYDFITRVSGELEISDASGELELKRLLALRSALKGIPQGQTDVSPYREFISENEASIVYSEPAGVYFVTANRFWELHEKYRSNTVSDPIAWEAARNPLPGECEGYVNCHLFDIRMRFGEYLNLHPNGRNAGEALVNITNYLEPISADADQKSVYSGPTDVTDRAEFNNLVAELRTIVARLGFVEKEKTLGQLRKIAEAYR